MPEMPLNPFPENLLEVIKFETVTLSSGIALPVTLRSATLKDMPHVEDLIRQAALNGEGFALDEFQDGFFNRKFLRHSHTLVATQPIVTSSSYDSDNLHERIIGAALFGPTTLCRSASTLAMGCYFIVLPEFRRQGIGKALLHNVEEFSRSNGYDTLLSDVFIDNTLALRIAPKYNFMCVGSLHKCAITKNSGLVDSLMYHKYLNAVSFWSNYSQYINWKTGIQDTGEIIRWNGNTCKKSNSIIRIEKVTKIVHNYRFAYSYPAVRVQEFMWAPPIRTWERICTIPL